MSADTKTAVKLWVMWLIIGAGVIAIFIDTWRRVDGRYASEGLITEAMMCVVIGGIPSIAFAGVVSVAFRLLARPRVNALPLNVEASKRQTSAVSGNHDFID